MAPKWCQKNKNFVLTFRGVNLFLMTWRLWMHKIYCVEVLLPRNNRIDKANLFSVRFSKDVRCFVLLFCHNKIMNMSCLICIACDFASHKTSCYNNRNFNNRLLSSKALLMIEKLLIVLSPMLVLCTSFVCVKTICAFFDTNLRTHLIWLLAVNIFISSL